jgi:alkanesulfonate monooxygenase SsuD/methylene tetrahydromethanopterin reductase-like flavin-dependent oxidoreductase (luciferase family)
MPDIPLGVLDLVPTPSGSTTADALRNSIDLAQRAERHGYARYWFAEHHLKRASLARPPRSSSHSPPPPPPRSGSAPAPYNSAIAPRCPRSWCSA